MSAADIEICCDHARVAWPALARLIASAGLGERDPALVERVFRGSHAVVYAFCANELVAAGRAISDGVTSSALFDIVVSPAHQGRGLGRRVTASLLARLPQRSVLLLSVPEKQGFYAKLGFRRLKSAMMRHEEPSAWIDGGYME